MQICKGSLWGRTLVHCNRGVPNWNIPSAAHGLIMLECMQSRNATIQHGHRVLLDSTGAPGTHCVACGKGGNHVDAESSNHYTAMRPHIG